MSISDSLTVPEAAERLGIGPAAMRRKITSGQVPAIKRGRSWWLDEQAVERVARQRPGAGRPLSAEMAWSILLLASGEHDAAELAAGRRRYWSRVRTWLHQHPLHEHAPRLRARAQVEQFDAHPSELPRILGRPDVLVTGVSASDEVGVVGAYSVVEVYAPAERRRALVDEHALLAGAGPVRIRWVPDAVWPLFPHNERRRAPRAAILLDLLECDEPRARREAARALTT